MNNTSIVMDCCLLVYESHSHLFPRASAKVTMILTAQQSSLNGSDIDDGGEVEDNIYHNFGLNGVADVLHIPHTWGTGMKVSTIFDFKKRGNVFREPVLYGSIGFFAFKIPVYLHRSLSFPLSLSQHCSQLSFLLFCIVI